MFRRNTFRLLVALAALVTSLVVQSVGQAGTFGNLPIAKPALVSLDKAKVKQTPTPHRVPVFAINAVKFYAADESGYDWAGSDEPMFVFTSAIGNGNPYTVRTKEFGDVDSGDWRSLDNMCLLASCPSGFTVPTTLSIQLFEIDWGSPEDVRKRVEQAAQLIKWGSLIFTGGAVSVPDSFIQYLTNLAGNDLMGSKTLRFDPQELVKQLPTAGSSLVEKHHLGGNSGDLPWEVAGGPDYDLYLQITRLPDRIYVY
jgi:hypothetical protein